MDHNNKSQGSRFWQAILHELRWLTPGLGVKRWIGLTLAGITLLGLGFAVLILDFYRTAPDTWWIPVLSTLSLRFLPRVFRAPIFGGSGVILIGLGMWGLNRALLKPFVRPGKPLLETVSDYRRRGRGPQIVTIGGGTGMSALLRGLKAHTHNLTAIVTVADDGGSSGELRRTIGILPPGDIRSCLAALSNDEALLTQMFQYRFASGAGLNGHTLGNLLITALTEITGSFEEAVAETGRVLAVQGRVLPATLHDVGLIASIALQGQDDEVLVKGESRITDANGVIKRIWLEPDNPLAFPPAIQAILNADLVILGPGSLYTSILPNLLVPDIAAVLRASRALKFYVGNVATQQGETDNYSLGDHIAAIESHLDERIFDLLVCNNNYSGKLPKNIEWVKSEETLSDKYVVYFSDLIDQENPWRHDSEKIAQSIMDLFYERTGPLLLRDEELEF
jgi:uncharacterized cofD-like protein